MRKIKFIIVSSLLFTSFCSCSKEEQIIAPQNNLNMPIISLSDSSVQKGEKIFAYGKNLDNYKLRYVTLNNVNVLSKTNSDSVFSLFIPFNAGNGKFSFYFYTPTHQDTIIESPNVSIIGDCAENVCLSWNEGEILDETDSWITDEDTIKWNISIQSDTVIIQRGYNCGDECYTKNTIVFRNNVTNQLPEYLYAIRWYRDWIDPVIEDTIKSAVIKIDKWNSLSVYSGTITFDDDLWVFWVKE
jgi:hypothetical protein